MEHTSIRNYSQIISGKQLYLNQTEENNKPDNVAQLANLRLFSINKVSKILGIRYETVVKLVKSGRIRSVMTINNKHKIPYSSLVEFVNGSKEVKKVTTQAVPIEVTQNRIDNLLKEYAG